MIGKTFLLEITLEKQKKTNFDDNRSRSQRIRTGEKLNHLLTMAENGSKEW